MSERIGVVGLGYVGLPLALELAQCFDLVGQDIDEARIDELRRGHDRTHESDGQTVASTRCRFTTDPGQLADCSFYIIAVPTPICEDGHPDLSAMYAASHAVGAHLKAGDIVVYECTVYPGLTESMCAQWLEQASGLRVGEDIGLGYSPERINPGDHSHTLRNIPKIISASDAATLDRMEAVYSTVVDAGMHRARDIRTAEACKVIENAQRNVNIAFMNEISHVMEAIDVSMADVMAAMATKWNHLPFHPGLVGGHCIGVDPYYLVACANNAGEPVPLLKQALQTNDDYASRLAEQLERRLDGLVGRRVGVLGLPYKADVLDLRNTRVPDLAACIRQRGATVLVHDPLIEPEVALAKTGVTLEPVHRMVDLDAVVLAVPHRCWRDDLDSLRKMLVPGGLLFDPHQKLPAERVPAGIRYAAV